MSLTAEKRARIKYYIMEKIFFKHKDIVEHTSDTFGISQQTVYKYILPFRNCVPVENELINIHCGQQAYIIKSSI